MGNQQSPDEPPSNDLEDQASEELDDNWDDLGEQKDDIVVAPHPHTAHSTHSHTGNFVILYDKLPVNQLKERDSFEVAKLDVGTKVEVVEIFPRPVEYRIRARLRAPDGWITLRTAQDDQPCQSIFAQACEWEPPSYDEREYPSIFDISPPKDVHANVPKRSSIGAITNSLPVGRFGARNDMTNRSAADDFTLGGRYGPNQLLALTSGAPPTTHLGIASLPHTNGTTNDQLALFGPAVTTNALGSNTHAADPPDLRMPKNEAVDNQAGYSGERDELGRRHGDGTQLLPDGRRYAGQFVKNTFSGAGMMNWPDGHKFIGQYENNQKQGDGFFLWPDGRCYDGQWKNGQRHGLGQYIASESYVGEYCEGFRHGDGVLMWPDGKRYSGEFCRGSFHGSAVMTWPDGRQYFGQYVDNLKEGEGLFHWPDGRMYDGQWHKGMRHGSCRFLDADGVEYEGQYRKDRLAKSKLALVPGVRDQFCEAPITLLSLRPTMKTDADMKSTPAALSEATSHMRPARSDPNRMDFMRMAPIGSDVFESHESGFGRSTGRVRSRGNLPTRGDSNIDSSGLSADDVTLNVQDYHTDRGEVYVDYVPDDVNVIKIDGVAHPLYDLTHLRKMPLTALRDHAACLVETFGEAIGSTPPNSDQSLLGWVYEVQARHLKPILELALRDVGGDLKEDVLVVSADSLQHLHTMPSASREPPKEVHHAHYDHDHDNTITPSPNQRVSDTSTQHYLAFGERDEVATVDDVSDDSRRVAPPPAVIEPAPTNSRRQRTRVFKDDEKK